MGGIECIHSPLYAKDGDTFRRSKLPEAVADRALSAPLAIIFSPPSCFSFYYTTHWFLVHSFFGGLVGVISVVVLVS